jgi:hypothetical protein|tara:strand:+ start:1459 stop:2070 length:612 start_codon:yes stop_codon:yes gene_type:complete
MSSDNCLLSKEEVLLDSLHDFYKNKNNLNKILPIVTGTSELSLRVLDYFVTNYSKNNSINLGNKNDTKYNVYHDYKNKLKSYNKRFFDPFCRINKKNITNKIAFKYDDEKYIVTTIGQLNFFRWAIRNKIIDYVINDLENINNEMNNYNCKKKIFKTKYENKIEKDINLTTVINFGDYKRSSINVKASNINNEKYNITKLEFK